MVNGEFACESFTFCIKFWGIHNFSLQLSLTIAIHHSLEKQN